MTTRFELADGSYILTDGVHGTLNLKNADGGETNIAMDSDIVRNIGSVFTDAEQGAFFARELEYIKARTYDVQYAELKARMLFPVSNDGGKGVDTITYRTYDQVGTAKIINAYADDLPRADVAGKETTIPVRSVGSSYGYNLDEIQSAQLVGRPLDQRRANAARRAVEQVVNDVAFFGSDADGLPGFFSNPNIPTGSVVNPGSGTEWVNKTPDQIIFDINAVLGDVWEGTAMIESANKIMIPPAQWNYIASTPRASNSDTTIASFVGDASPFLGSAADIVPVNECSTQFNAVITNDVMVAYTMSPDKLQLEIPVEMEWMPVQQKNLEFVVPGRLRLGGLNVYYPLSAAFREGI